MESPTYDELIKRIEALERRKIEVKDLPIAPLTRKLEQVWQPDGSVLLLPNSVPGTTRVGSGFLWFTDTAPPGCILAVGANISRSVYGELFRLWGTKYGSGDGSTTFGTPNLARRFPIGLDSSSVPYNSTGKVGGEENHVLTPAETAMKAHAHTVGQHAHQMDYSWSASQAGSNFGFSQPAGDGAGNNAFGAIYTRNSPNMLTINNPTDANGGAHNNMPLFFVVHFAIYTGTGG